MRNLLPFLAALTIICVTADDTVYSEQGDAELYDRPIEEEYEEPETMEIKPDERTFSYEPPKFKKTGKLAVSGEDIKYTCNPIDMNKSVLEYRVHYN